MRVLVCGGREFSDRELVQRVLAQLNDETPISVIIEGGDGAGTIAFTLAGANGWGAECHGADWKAFGPASNERMLDRGRPDLVVAFRGGEETADMVQQAVKRRLRIVEVNPGFLFETVGKKG